MTPPVTSTPQSPPPADATASTAPRASGLELSPELAAAVAGDRAAAAHVLRAALPRVRNLVRYLVRRDADVDDIAQEALVAIARGLGSYRGEGSFHAWCDRITAREALRQQRRAHARAAQEREVAIAEEAHATVAHASERWLERRRAVAWLDTLPDAQREVIVLHHVMGLSVPEIAEELESPAETVRTRLRLGMQKLRLRASTEEAR